MDVKASDYISPQLSAGIVAGMPLPTWVMRWQEPPDVETFIVVSANDAATELIGKSLGQVVGTRFSDSFPDTLKTVIPALAIEVIKSQKPQRRRIEVDAKPSIVFDVRMFTIEPNTIAIIAEDITGEHRRE